MKTTGEGQGPKDGEWSGGNTTGTRGAQKCEAEVTEILKKDRRRRGRRKGYSGGVLRETMSTSELEGVFAERCRENFRKVGKSGN